MTLITDETEIEQLDPHDAGICTYTLVFDPKGAIEVKMTGTVEFPTGTVVREYAAKYELAIRIVEILTDIQGACLAQSFKDETDG
jgi:hypothetical protein